MSREKLTSKEWTTFFELVEKIVAMPGTWKEKKEVVENEAAAQGVDASFEEFVGWFAPSE